MFTIAAASMIITVILGLARLFSCGGIRFSKQCTRSDFVPDLIAPACDSDGGKA